ncbi:sensor histidine kinase [Maricaulis parjimensis]|uniref:sensor histidine kinase n=1 Tax=Maricaulis parjimensis TaxID=144023 RepID=UPI00193A4E9B|nr:histidine kinase [Maricaulis parjimensis]
MSFSDSGRFDAPTPRLTSRWGVLTIVVLSFGFWGTFSVLALIANWEPISAHLPMLWRFVLADVIGALLSIGIAWRLAEVRHWSAPGRLVLAAALSLAAVTIYAGLAAYLIAPMRPDRLDGVEAGIHVLQIMFKHYWIFIGHAGFFLLLDQDRPAAPAETAETARYHAVRTAMLGQDEAHAGLNARWFWTFQGVFWATMFVFSTANAINNGDSALNIWRISLVESVAMGMTAVVHYVALRPSRNWSLYRRAALALACAIVLTLGYITSIWAAHYVIFPVDPPIINGAPADRGISFFLYVAPFWFFLNFPVFVGWSGFYLALDAARRLRTQERQLYNSIMMAQESQLKMLRFQLNPHFLFNTLNAISTLLLDRRNDEADMMLTRLSRFLRFTLDVAPDDQLPLSAELDAQRLYLDIEATRFPDRLRVEIDLDPRVADALVPTLILQPLLENAVKYAVSATSDPVRVSVRAVPSEPGRLKITVSDTGAGAGNPGVSSGTGVGLANIRSRLDVLYGDRASMKAGPTEDGGFSVVLELPMETIRKSGDTENARTSG